MTAPPDWLRSSYAYPFDTGLIAQHPVSPRDSSRLLSYDRATGHVAHEQFRAIAAHLQAGDLLVVNTTRVLPARLRPRRAETGSQIEIMLVRARSDVEWQALVRPGRRVRVGMVYEFDDGVTVEVTERLPDGKRVVHFSRAVELEWLERIGEMPLPPYIQRPGERADHADYQTVYADAPGAVAAPTAGLHFTPNLLRELETMGVRRADVVLHVGPGTFRPVRADDIREHPMDAEYYEVPRETIQAIRRTREAGGRVIAVGTTSVRTLETLAETGQIEADRAASGWTRMFIYPPYEMRLVDGLITNFHLPESTLIMLVSALAGRERTMELYREAVERRYRFYSFGDAMLIL